MSLFAAIMGAGNTSYETIDSDGGNHVEIVTSHTEGVPEVPLTTVQDAGYKRDYGTELHSRVSLAERNVDMAKARASSQYERMSGQAYNATMRVRGTHAVEPLEYITVDVIRRDGSRHYLSGTFRVITIDHTLDNSGWVTEFYMLRDGVNYAEGLAKLDPDIQVKPLTYPNSQDTGTKNTALDSFGGTSHPASPGGDTSRRDKKES